MLIDFAQPASLRMPRAASVVQALVSRVSPFSAASPEARAAFAAASRRIDLRAGELAFRAEQSPRGFMLVSRGIVKFVRSRCGRSTIPELFGPGEAMGHVFAIRDMPYPVDAVALTPTAEVVEIPRGEVMARAQREPAFALALADACAVRAVRMLDAYAILAAGGTEARLAAMLLDLIERFGDIDEEGLVRVPVSLSRAELAACISTTTETVIRSMSRWARERFVETTQDGFVVHDLDRLRSVAEPLQLRARREAVEAPGQRAATHPDFVVRDRRPPCAS